MNAARLERHCAFCGLPLTEGFAIGRNASAETEQAEYCCSGCRTVANIQGQTPLDGAAAHSLFRLGLGVFLAMNVMVFTMALWSRDLYDAEAFATPLAGAMRSVFRWAAMLFSVPVLLLLGGPIAAGVRQALRRGAVTTDLLLLLGIGAAYGYSAVSVVRGSGHVYFEVGVMVLVFVSIGRWLEARGKRRASASLDALATLLPEKVRRQDAQGRFVDTPRAQIEVGDRIRVLPGERFAVDGVVVSGPSMVDQRIVTGESRPVEIRPGDSVPSGALNLDGDVQLDVTSATGEETVSRLLNLVRAARSVKGPHERLADRVAAWFVPLVLLIAVASGYVRYAQLGLDEAILTGLAVTLIACPCALGLATPLAVWTALGRAASAGVLFRSGVVLERLAHVGVVCFDKTGTLTDGEPDSRRCRVVDGEDRSEVLNAAEMVAAGSNHLLSKALLRWVASQRRRSTAATAPRVETIPARGLACETPGYGTILLGSNRLMQEQGVRWPSSLPKSELVDSSALRIFLAWDNQIRAWFDFQERLRPETVAAIEQCRDLGLELAILTGDSPDRAAAVGGSLGIVVQSQQRPEDKVAAIRRRRGRTGVAMIGEGLNDAPALAESDVGVALGCGVDISRDAASVCLIGDDLRQFPWAVSLARQTMRIVRQNLFWAFAYNTAGIALAASGKLNPIWAALAMAMSSAVVVSNSARLGRFPEPSAGLESPPWNPIELGAAGDGDRSAAAEDVGDSRMPFESPLAATVR